MAVSRKETGINKKFIARIKKAQVRIRVWSKEKRDAARGGDYPPASGEGTR